MSLFAVPGAASGGAQASDEASQQLRRLNRFQRHQRRNPETGEVVDVLSIQRVQGEFPRGLITRNSCCLNQHHHVLVRVQPGERNFGCRRQVLVVELSDEQRTGRIDTKLSGSKWIAGNDRGKFFCIRDLKSSSKGINPESPDGYIEEADGILHLDRNGKIARTGLDEWNRPLSKAGMPRDGKHRGPASACHLEHSICYRRIKNVETGGGLVEIVAVSHPRIGDEIVETGMNSSPYDDSVSGIDRTLGTHCPQLRVSRPETDDGYARLGSGHAFVAALSAPRLRTARNASCGISTLPTSFILALPSFCFSRSFRFRVTSPP